MKKRTVTKMLAAASLLALVACQSPEDRVNYFVANGQDYLQQDQPMLARIEFNNALQINPDHPPALAGIARALAALKREARAAQFLGRAHELEPTNVDYILELGRLLVGMSEFDELDRLSTLALELAPERAASHALRASFFQAMRQNEQAAVLAQRALEMDPTNRDALIVLSVERITAGDPSGAIQYLERGLELNVMDTDLRLLKVEALQRFQMTDQVIAEYRRLTELFPNELQYFRALGSYLVQNNRIEDAFEIFESMVTQFPDDPERKLDVIRLVNTVNGPESAIQYCDAFLSNDPTLSRIGMIKGALLLNANRVEEALQTFEITASQATSDKARVEAIAEIGRVNFALDNLPLTRKALTDILAIDPKDENGLILRSDIASRERRYDDAVADLRTVLVDSPFSYRAASKLARVHELQGANSLATDQYEQALRNSNYSPSVGIDYANFLRRRGDLDRAGQVLEAVLSRNPRHIPALRQIGRLRIEQQDWSGALEIANYIENEIEDENLAKRLSAAVAANQNNVPDAVEQLREIYAQAPTAILPIINLVQTYTSAGRIGDAEALLNEILSGSNPGPEVHALMAGIQELKGNSEQALSHLTQALDAGPTNSFVLQTAFNFYLRRGDQEKASEVLEVGLTADENLGSARLLKADLLFAQNDLEGVIGVYEDLIEDYPYAEVVVNNLASLLTDVRGDKESLRRALTLSQRFTASRVAMYRDTYGWALVKNGDIADGLRILRGALEDEPNNALIQMHVGYALARSGDVDGARSAYERARALAEVNNRTLIADIDAYLASLSASSAN